MAKISSPPLKALIIDNHVLVRQVVSSILRNLKGNPVIHSISSSASKNLLAELSQVQPDVIFLGIDTPDSKEMELLAKIRQKYPMLPVIIMTPLSRDGAKTAIKGLKLGAIEFITKPDQNIGIMLAHHHFRKRIVPLMEHIHDINLNLLLAGHTEGESIPEVKIITDKKPQKTSNFFEVVVVAGCSGGVNALFKLVSALPDDLPLPVIIVQHLPKMYSRELAEELDKITPMNVREAQNDSPLIAGQIYIAPGGYHTIVKNDGVRKKLFIHRGPRERKNRPSIDVLLRSVVQVYNSKVLSVFLSGGGKDGLNGAGYVVDAGGKLILQDRDSSLLWALPSQLAEIYPALQEVHIAGLGAEIMKNIMGTPDMRNKRTAEKEAYWNWGYADR